MPANNVPSTTAPAAAAPAPARPPRRLRQVLSLDDFERLARRHLPRPIHAYISGAVEDNASLADNRRAFAELAFVPRALVGVAQRDPSFELFGRRYGAPFGVAPMGIAALSAYRGDLVLAQAAQQAGVPAIMSGSSLIRLEDVMAAAPHTWFQAYLPGDQGQIDALLDRVAAAGVQTLVITVDTPVAANRENNVRAGFSTPLRPGPGLAWQGISHPRWLFGSFLKTLWRHGMPHFENNYAHRGAPHPVGQRDARFLGPLPPGLAASGLHPPALAGATGGQGHSFGRRRRAGARPRGRRPHRLQPRRGASSTAPWHRCACCPASCAPCPACP